MISYISGKILTTSAEYVVVVVNNIGYKVSVPLHNLIEGADVSLFLHTHYNQENGSQLWGFFTVEELKMFEQLLQVNGVGPKTAALLVYDLGISKIVQAISSEQPKELKVPGIGAKTSERIIIDMRDKISQFGQSTATGEKPTKKNMPYYDSIISTLENLGYQNSTAVEMYHLANITEELTLSEAIKKALSAGK